MKNPRELTHMFEEISRSIEMKDEYDSRKKEMDMSHEDANGRFNKKKVRGFSVQLLTHVCLCHL